MILMIVLIIELEGFRRALAKGQASQGTREQGRESAQAARPASSNGKVAIDDTLRGHWHSGYGVGLRAFPPYEAQNCYYNTKVFSGGLQPVEVARDCPLRDKRSTR